jgi:hypothetical protein
MILWEKLKDIQWISRADTGECLYSFLAFEARPISENIWQQKDAYYTRSHVYGQMTLNGVWNIHLEIPWEYSNNDFEKYLKFHWLLWYLLHDNYDIFVIRAMNFQR